MIKNKRSICIHASINQLHEVEEFVEKICDDYHIFNSYFGIILYSVDEIFRTVALHKHEKPDTLRIDFTSSRKGLLFTFYVGEVILELASLLQDDIISSEKEAEETNQQLPVVKLLCDELVIDAEKCVLTLLFNMVSINQHLALERYKALEQYYNHIKQSIKV